MTSKVVIGSASHPPRDAGSDSRNRPAFLTLAARSAGIVRLVSPSAARARNSGARASARASNSSRLSLRPMPLTRSPFLLQSSETQCDSGVDFSQVVPAAADTPPVQQKANLGGSVSIAVLQTFVTKRAHFHSSIGTARASLLDPATRDRIASLQERFLAVGASDPATAWHDAVVQIGRIVRAQSCLLAYSGAFYLMGAALLLALITSLAMRKSCGGGAGARTEQSGSLMKKVRGIRADLDDRLVTVPDPSGELLPRDIPRRSLSGFSSEEPMFPRLALFRRQVYPKNTSI